METGDEENEKRICIIGAKSCGKTCLIKRLKFDSFDPTETSTIGLVPYDLEHPHSGKPLKLSFLDRPANLKATMTYFAGANMIIGFYETNS